MGNRTTLKRTTPIPVCAVGSTDCESAGLGDVVSVSTGSWHTLSLLSNGTVVALGWQLLRPVG